MKNKKIKLMCISAVFVALIFIFTAYIHVPILTGYTHIGDGFIYLAACLLPLEYSIFVSSGGALLADLLSGYALWAPASAIIKAVTVLVFSRKCKKIICKRNILALIPALFICTGGYYLYEALITQNFYSPLLGILGNVIQSTLSGVLFTILGLYLDKLKIKDRL
ncbi:MAG: TIGR04002 family protein [Ruminococcaceae bacterium]|nr:TIGR04002 family protein [Oscillospiraceae bacterium]